ncbi:hypothetical protein FDP41_009299 [Naegleria fowleri]|uniref:Ubiquitin-like domain-containing protein n=1 Tax=Naegleria fowleri TaxID=5763 RepID=A0A6A5BCI6_NAEFO|nr:uncharacterized protein FDP41_009299 [Naegleria fowleri]KAF0972396.1 hypothetical protein FDP41_009299 [Naegleria fowleri]CAG4717427.1 unnamed protein product [Naegleria fowleri]
MSKRSFGNYSSGDQAFHHFVISSMCKTEPDFVPQFPILLSTSDQSYCTLTNDYESNFKKKKFSTISDSVIPSPPCNSAFSSTTNTLFLQTLNNSSNNCNIFPPKTNHQQIENVNIIEDDDAKHHQEQHSMEDDEVTFTFTTSCNDTNLYRHRKHLQHIEYLRATVINQEINKNVINFQVKGVSGQTICFNQVDIERSTLLELQQIVYQQIGIPIQKQRLVLKGRIIPFTNNTTRLSEIPGIENNCTFQLVCALKGG